MILTDNATSPATYRPTHAVDIFAFVEAQEIPVHYFDTPYYLAPVPGGENAYALLREALRRTRKVGIAYVVIQMRRHLAALVPQGKALVLNTLRCASEARGFDTVRLVPEEFAPCGDISESDLVAAARLVDSMTEQWDALRGQNGPNAANGTHGANTPSPSEPDRGWLQRPPDAMAEAAPEVDAPSALFDLGADEGICCGHDVFLDSLWGRPHRRRLRHASRGEQLSRLGADGTMRSRLRRNEH